MNRQTPPSIHKLQPLHLPEIHEQSFLSGPRMLFYENCDNDIAQISVIVPGGIAESATPATAMLAAQMQREGTLSLSSAEFSRILDLNGAWIKSSAVSHHTVHSIFALRRCFNDVLPAFIEMVFSPRFPDAELEVRREMLARNIEVSMTDVAYRGRCLSEKMIMGADHPLASEDTPHTVREITAEDLRRFHNDHASVQSATVIVCAATSAEEKRRIAKAFECIGRKPSRALNIRGFNAAEAGARSIIRMPAASQSSVSLTLPAIPRSHPDYLPLHLTIYALGGYFGSRLMLNIREEKGLTYGIYASLQGYIDGAYAEISAETSNDNVGQLIEEVRLEMQRLASQPCRGDELYRLRQSAFSSQAAVLDSPLSVTGHYITAILSGLPDGYFEAKQRAIETLTSDTIAEMASKYLRPENLRTAIAGNPL